MEKEKSMISVNKELNIQKSETENIKNLIYTIQKNNIKFRSEKYLPYVYTEQGISMLAGILKNEIAVKVSISIMKAFVEMRKFISLNGQVFERLTNVEYKLLEHDKKFDEIFNELQKNQQENFKQMVFFDGQIFDAYNLIIDFIKREKLKISNEDL